jgi:hypothetical protein
MAKKSTSNKSAKAEKSSIKTDNSQPKIIKKTLKRITLKSLRRWNIWLAVLLVAQAIAIIIMGKSSALPINGGLMNVDALASEAAGHQVLVPAVRHLFDVNILVVVIVFLLISALFHSLIASYSRRKYEADVMRGVNELRWLDYGLSAGVMLSAIALLNGVFDLGSLIMVFVLVVLLHLLGFFLEIQNGATAATKAKEFKGLLLAGGAIWLVVAIYLKMSVIYGVGLPHYIYFIDGTIFALTLGLAFNTYMSYQQKGKWSDYLYGERNYMILSTIAKSILAWQIFFGLLR